MAVDIETLACEIHSDNVKAGWWDDWPDKTKRHETAMMLVVSEVAEAMEGFRKDLMDDHLPDHKMFDVELADAMIRLLDLAGAYDTHMDGVERSVARTAEFWSSLPVPGQLYRIVRGMTSQSILDSVDLRVRSGIVAVMAVAKINDVDLWHLVKLKREYNANRADHKPAARAAKNGKKF